MAPIESLCCLHYSVFVYSVGLETKFNLSNDPIGETPRPKIRKLDKHRECFFPDIGAQFVLYGENIPVIIRLN